MATLGFPETGLGPSLSQLIDLSFGAPAGKVVNFHALKTVLHSILDHLDISHLKPELDAVESNLFITQISESKSFGLDGGGTRRKVKLVAPEDSSESYSSETYTSASTESQSKDPTEKTVQNNTPPVAVKSTNEDLKMSSQTKLAKPEQGTIKDVKYSNTSLEDISPSPSKAELVAANASNRELFDAVLGKQRKPLDDGSRPVTLLMETIQLKKRVECNEDTINKLASLLEDMILEMNKNNELIAKMRDMLGEMDNTDQMKATEKKLADLLNMLNELKQMCSNFIRKDECDKWVTWPSLEEALQKLKNEMESMCGNFLTADLADMWVTWQGLEEALKGLKVHMVSTAIQASLRKAINHDSPPSRPASAAKEVPASNGPSEELEKILQRIGQLDENHVLLRKRVDILEEELKKKADKDDLDALAALIPDNLSSRLQILQDLIDKLERNANQKSPVTPAGPNLQDLEELKRLRKIAEELRRELDCVKGSVRNLEVDSAHKQERIEANSKATLTLDECKVDKKDLEDLLSGKANVDDLATKLDSELFDQVCEELRNAIRDILQTLNKHMDDTNKSIMDILKELEEKLDADEFRAFKEKYNHAMKDILLKLAELMRFYDNDDDAAGFKKKMNVKCISCDRPVVLGPTDAVPSIPEPRGVPIMHRPFTAFPEYDERRIHTKRTPDAYRDQYGLQRPCGGGHTMTNPHRRSAKMNQ